MLIKGRVLFFFGFASAAVLTGCGTSDDSSDTSKKAGHGQDYNWQDHIQLATTDVYSWSGNDYQSAMLRDVMTHTNDRFLNSSPTTNAHETAHGLHAQMRNKTSARDNFLYYQEGQGAYIVEPQMHMRNVARYVPQAASRLADGRYQLYLINQARSWSEVFYLYDEWNSYIVNARTGVEMVNAGTWSGGMTDEVDGAMDFLYFGSAAILALKENEPGFVNGNEQLKALFAMMAERTMSWVNQGLEIDDFKGFHAAELKQHFVTSSENQAIRSMLVEWYGSEWTQRVFGF